MRREIGDGYELDDDPARIDLDAVHGYLSEEAYWAKGRSREVQDAMIDNAARVVGLYHEGRQVGFSRAISDGHVQSYLADVYVLEEHRGRGLGVELVRFSVDEGAAREDEVAPAHGGRARALPQVRLRGARPADARARTALNRHRGRPLSRASATSSPARACPGRMPAHPRSGSAPARESRGRGS